jgi:hypothetical protein
MIERYWDIRILEKELLGDGQVELLMFCKSAYQSTDGESHDERDHAKGGVRRSVRWTAHSWNQGISLTLFRFCLELFALRYVMSF